MVAKRSDILAFLTKIKMNTAASFDFVWTAKNKEAMIQLGYTSKSDVIYHINVLTIGDYAEGPCEDHDLARMEDVWVFAPEITGLIFYIKLKLVGNQVKCLSFHEAEHIVSHYPFRKT